MSDILRDLLGLSSQSKSNLGKWVGKLKSIATFFSDAIDAVKDTSAVEAIARSVPWAEAAGTAFTEAVPVVKFAATLFTELTKEQDPHVLGFLACTLAYQRSVEEAMNWAGIPDQAKNAKNELKPKLAELEPSADVDFKKFSFSTALEHEFIRRADHAFTSYLEAVGYNESEKRDLLNRVHLRFVGNLKMILSNGKLKGRFEPFTQLMELGTKEELAYDTILSHVNYQRWLFEEAPVFRKEPFALSDIYIDSECGKLTWGEIQTDAEQTPGAKPERIDPFAEGCGGRHDLLEVVLALIGESNFDEAIVIQGAAGSGKSTFTLKLCSVLEKEGLYPIRVRLRDLPLDRHLVEALPKALFPPDRELPPASRGSGCDDPFLGGKIFDETTNFRGSTICPYVLMLDGWDEISISATEGFKVRIARMLDQVRSQFLHRQSRIKCSKRPQSTI
jgi:hypothetical protein